MAGFKSESDTYFSLQWAAHYFIYHFRPYFFPALHARLSHSLGKPALTKMSEKHMLLESFFEKRKRSNDETAGN